MGKTVGRVYEQCFTPGVGVLARPAAGPAENQTLLKPWPVEPVGFSEDESLLPYDARSPQGYRLLHEYGVFPQRYMFFRLTDLGPAVRKCSGNRFDLILLFAAADPDLERAVTTDMFRLFCTPAANLFAKPLDRVPVRPQQREYHVVPEHTRPLDFEIYRIQKVTGCNDKGESMQEFTPFYQAQDTLGPRPTGHFTARRIPRLSSSANQAGAGGPAPYLGGEVFLSLADDAGLPLDLGVKQLAVEAWCTNRGLPLTLLIGSGQTQFSLTVAAPCTAARCLGTPTPPRPAPPEDSRAWRLIHHLSHNHLALAGSSPQEAARSLQELLGLYSNLDQPAARRQIEGLTSVESRPAVKRMVSPNCVGVVRGLTVTVTFEESAFEGSGCFLLGAVLDRFLAGKVSINSFTETVVRTVERGEIRRWPKRLGTKQVL
jgi:type VI secretion system protein ImpG